MSYTILSPKTIKVSCDETHTYMRDIGGIWRKSQQSWYVPMGKLDRVEAYLKSKFQSQPESDVVEPCLPRKRGRPKGSKNKARTDAPKKGRKHTGSVHADADNHEEEHPDADNHEEEHPDADNHEKDQPIDNAIFEEPVEQTVEEVDHSDMRSERSEHGDVSSILEPEQSKEQDDDVSEHPAEQEESEHSVQGEHDRVDPEHIDQGEQHIESGRPTLDELPLEPENAVPSEGDTSIHVQPIVVPLPEQEHPRKVINPVTRNIMKSRRDFIDEYVNNDEDEKERDQVYEKFKNLFRFYRTYSMEPPKQTAKATQQEVFASKLEMFKKALNIKNL